MPDEPITRRIQVDVPQSESHSLSVSIAGHYHSGPNYHCAPRTLERDFVVIYTERGAGWVRSGHEQRVVGADEAFVLGPGSEHEYRTHGDSWHLLWFHCYGTLPKMLLTAHGAGGWLPPVRCLEPAPLAALLLGILQELEQKRPYFDALAQAYAQTALAQLCRAAREPTAAQGGERTDLISLVTEHVRAHLTEPIDVGVLAEVAHMSHRHFTRRFRRMTGQPPQQYVQRLKLAEAKRLLIGSHRTIAEIAAAVGFADPYYFSRLFHQKVGESPSDFRKQMTGR
ncbi:MAG TPA: AraC family transcriptional regulator [Limnochordia bacterium]|nr:AraC family transcriptional regulator [Limnochordia bacterium]